MDDPDSNHDDGEDKEQKDYNNDGNPVMVGGQQQSQQQNTLNKMPFLSLLGAGLSVQAGNAL